MHAPSKPKPKCDCEVVATSGKDPTTCMTCGGGFD